MMGVRILIGERESIRLALKRLRHKCNHERLPWVKQGQLFFPADRTEERRAKRFQKRLKARYATLKAQMAGEQPVASLAAAAAEFRKRTGKP